MLMQRMALKNRVPSAHAHRRLNGSVVLRRFDPTCDSFDELTAMLHRSFAKLGKMGLNCTCVDQSSTVTRERATRGHCYVVACNGRLVGTMTLYGPDRDSQCDLYRREDVASMRQFAVDSSWQSRGIGTQLLAFADYWAATRGYAQLALDTPQPAAHLIALYRSQGFRIAQFVRFAGKQYDSAILSRTPTAARTRATWSHRLRLPGASIARAA